MKTKRRQSIIFLAIIFSAAAIMTTTITLIKTHNFIANAQIITRGTTNGGTVRVLAGGGNSTNVLVQYIPQHLVIKAGQSVSWYNPTSVGEPHTVTFALDNKTMTNVVGPFSLQGSTQLTAIPPSSNNEALKMPGKNNVVIAFNARSFLPTVIDSNGKTKIFAPDAAYTMNGNEKYVNSGWLLPKGQEQGFPGASNTFTVTFLKPGTYNYVCEVHPWMQGSVTVK